MYLNDASELQLCRARDFVLLLAGRALAALPANDDVAARRAADARNERDVARQVRDADAGVAGDYFRLGPFITDDLARLRRPVRSRWRCTRRLQRRSSRGDDEAVKRLRVEQEKALCERAVYRERIVEYRNRQFTVLPNEQWFGQYLRWSHFGMEELMAWGERKAVAQAWGDVAEACKPGYDAKGLEALKEKAYALEVEQEIAEMRFNWCGREQVLQSDKRVSSAEVNQKVEA